MTDVRNLQREFSEVEEEIIRAFSKEIQADRVEISVDSAGKDVFEIVNGLTEISVDIIIEDDKRFVFVYANNVTPGCHFMGNYLENPSELKKELELLKIRIK